MTGPGSRRVDVRVFALVLRLAPREFRRMYGDEMTRLHVERRDRARTRGRGAALRVAAGGVIDLIVQVLQLRGEARQARPRGDAMFTSVLKDLRLGIRTLRRAPGFTAASVSMLALGCGAVTVGLALVDAALLRPVPYPEASRLMSIVRTDPRYAWVPFAPPYLGAVRDAAARFDTVAGFSSTWNVVLEGDSEREVGASYVTDGALELLGARPLAGRLFTPNEHTAPTMVTLVSARLWREIAGGAPFAERRIVLNATPYTVVGILPSTLRMPITASIVNPRNEPADLWLPFSTNPFAALRTIPVMNLLGRLGPDADPARAAEQLNAALAPLQVADRDFGDAPIRVVPLDTLVSASVRRPLYLFLGAVSCLLLIAVANVGNLALARMSARGREMAIRLSLGASRLRAVREMSVEALVLTAVAAAVGLAGAAWILAALPALVVDGLPPSARLHLTPRVLTAALLTAGVCAIALGLLPALQLGSASRSLPSQSGGRTTGTGASRRLGRALVAIETALAVLLLTGAGLMTRSFWELSRVDPGFETTRIAATTVNVSQRYPTADVRRTFVDSALLRLAALPGVQSAAAVNRLPLAGDNTLVGVDVEGETPVAGSSSMMDRRVITPAYLETLGIGLLEGRDFDGEDRAGSEPVAILNVTAARRIPAGRAVGQQVRLQLRSGPGPWLRVVGVVADVRHHGLGAAPQPEIYVPYNQAAVESMVFVVRSSGSAATLTPAMRTVIKEIDPHLHVLPTGQTTMAALAEASVAVQRLQAAAVNGFAALALGLAALGIYSVVAYTVVRRRRDVGVRMALGARPADVVRELVRESMAPVIVGGLLGLGCALLFSRVLTSLLFDVSPTDPAVFAGVAALLLLVALAAVLVPARRAARIDPVQALRAE